MFHTIIQKLREFNIVNIVSIDNEWDDNVVDIDIEQKIETIFEMYNIDPSAEEKRLIRNNSIISIKEFMESIDDGLHALQTRIKKVSKKRNIDQSLVALDKIFKQISEETKDIQIFKLSSERINLNSYQGNTLYIIDKNMGDGYEDIVIDKILEIKGTNSTGDLILIYSNECGNDYDNHQKKLDYINSKCDANVSDEKKITLLYQLWAIKKVGDENRLCENINNMLTLSMYGNSLNNIINIKRKSDKKAYKDLLMIDIEDLQGTFADSFIEGDNIISSFNRIIKAFTNKNYNDSTNWTVDAVNSYQFLLSYEKKRIAFIKNEVTSSPGVEDKYKSFKKEHTRKKLSNSKTNGSEYAIADYHINKFYYDIGTGDLFRYCKYGANNWEFCMLIAQECNNIIRMPLDRVSDTPNRNNREMKLLMLDAEEIPDGEISNNKLSILNNSISTRLWPIKVDGKYYSLSPTENVISIDPHILDLCSLNENGKAVKNPNISTALKFKGYQSDLYFNSFFNRSFWIEFERKGQLFSSKYKAILEEYLAECSATIDCNTKCIEDNGDSFIKIIESKTFDDIISMIYNIQYSDNSFKLERLCRIEPKRTLLTIQDYVHKLSRTGAEPVIAHTS